MTHSAARRRGGGSSNGYHHQPFIRSGVKITFKFGTRADPPDHEAVSSPFFRPQFPRPFFGPPRRTACRNCTKNLASFPSVCLAFPPLLARSPDRSLLINPFGGRCHCCRCPLHRTGFFSIDHFLCVCKMGANIKRKRLTRSLFDPLSLSLSLSLSSSSNPLRRLSNSGRTEFERWSHRLSLSLSPSLPTERTVIKLASRIANWLGGRMIFNRIPSGLKERERLRSDHFHTNG